MGPAVPLLPSHGWEPVSVNQGRFRLRRNRNAYEGAAPSVRPSYMRGSSKPARPPSLAGAAPALIRVPARSRLTPGFPGPSSWLD